MQFQKWYSGLMVLVVWSLRDKLLCCAFRPGYSGHASNWHLSYQYRGPSPNKISRSRHSFLNRNGKTSLRSVFSERISDIYIGENASYDDDMDKKEIMKLLDCISSPSDSLDPEFDFHKDLLRRELLRYNDISSLREECLRRGIKPALDKRDLLTALLIHKLDPSINIEDNRQMSSAPLESISDDELDRISTSNNKKRWTNAWSVLPDSEEFRLLRGRPRIPGSPNTRPILLDGMERSEVSIPVQCFCRDRAEAEAEDAFLLSATSSAGTSGGVQAYIVSPRPLGSSSVISSAGTVILVSDGDYRALELRLLADELATVTSHTVALLDLQRNAAHNRFFSHASSFSHLQQALQPAEHRKYSQKTRRRQTDDLLSAVQFFRSHRLLSHAASSASQQEVQCVAIGEVAGMVLETATWQQTLAAKQAAAQLMQTAKRTSRTVAAASASSAEVTAVDWEIEESDALHILQRFQVLPLPQSSDHYFAGDVEQIVTPAAGQTLKVLRKNGASNQAERNIDWQAWLTPRDTLRSTSSSSNGNDGSIYNSAALLDAENAISSNGTLISNDSIDHLIANGESSLSEEEADRGEESGNSEGAATDAYSLGTKLQDLSKQIAEQIMIASDGNASFVNRNHKKDLLTAQQLQSLAALLENESLSGEDPIEIQLNIATKAKNQRSKRAKQAHILNGAGLEESAKILKQQSPGFGSPSDALEWTDDEEDDFGRSSRFFTLPERLQRIFDIQAATGDPLWEPFGGSIRREDESLVTQLQLASLVCIYPTHYDARRVCDFLRLPVCLLVPDPELFEQEATPSSRLPDPHDHVKKESPQSPSIAQIVGLRKDDLQQWTDALLRDYRSMPDMSILAVASSHNLEKSNKQSKESSAAEVVDVTNAAALLCELSPSRLLSEHLPFLPWDESQRVQSSEDAASIDDDFVDQVTTDVPGKQNKSKSTASVETVCRMWQAAVLRYSPGVLRTDRTKSSKPLQTSSGSYLEAWDAVRARQALMALMGSWLEIYGRSLEGGDRPSVAGCFKLVNKAQWSEQRRYHSSAFIPSQLTNDEIGWDDAILQKYLSDAFEAPPANTEQEDDQGLGMSNTMDTLSAVRRLHYSHDSPAIHNKQGGISSLRQRSEGDWLRFLHIADSFASSSTGQENDARDVVASSPLTDGEEEERWRVLEDWRVVSRHSALLHWSASATRALQDWLQHTFLSGDDGDRCNWKVLQRLAVSPADRVTPEEVAQLHHWCAAARRIYDTTYNADGVDNIHNRNRNHHNSEVHDARNGEARLWQ